MSLTNLRHVFICLLITCLGFIPHNVLASIGLAWQSSGLTVRIEPAIQDVEPGHSFTVNVVVDGAVDLGAFQFDLIYDPTVVTVTTVELGPFLGSTGRTAQPAGLDKDNAAGIVTFGAFSFGSGAGPEGRGLLAAVTFAAVGQGTSALHLQNVLVTDTLANAQSASLEGGTVTVSAPAPTSTPTMTPSPTMPPAATPTLTRAPTATAVAEPVTTVTPSAAATATATREKTMTSSAPSDTTETATPVATALPTPTEPLTSTPTETATLTATTAPTPTEPLTSTPAQRLQPRATATRMLSPTPGAVSPQTPTLVPRSLEGSTATARATGLPSSSSPTAAWSEPLCWLSAGGMFLVVAGCAFCALLRRRGA